MKNILKKNLLTVLLVWAFILASPFRVGADVSIDTALADVEKHYQVLTDLTAKISQKNHFASLGKTQTFEGSLAIKKPGKLRLEYTNGQLILVNGKAALFYSKKNDQVIKKSFTDFEQMNIPVAFLLGAGHIRDDFEVIRPEAGQPRMLELTPKKPGAAMKKLLLKSDESGRITGMTIYDRSGNITEISFSDVRENEGLADKLFTFKVPKGAEVIEE